MTRAELPPIFRTGFRLDLGSHHFIEEEILAFARKYDPQPFHVDAEAARKSVLGGLCASGWQTVAIWMRKMRDYQSREIAKAQAGLGPRIVHGPSPGFNNLKWLRPVYVGDTISYFYEATASRASASRPGWHVVTGRNGGINQKGEPVLEFESTAFLKLETERT